jgi:signal transduction histidine kinase
MGITAIRGWSLRTKLMAVGLLGLAGAQAIGSVALAVSLHVFTERRLDRSATATATEVIALIDSGQLPRTLSVSGIELVQVLDADGRVVSASQNADRLTPMLQPDEVDAATDHPVVVSGSRAAISDQLQVRATPARVDGVTKTVLVAEPLDQISSNEELLRRVLIITYPLLLLVSGVIAWRVIGAAMRPVEEMRSAADRISGSGRGDRLPVPPSDDELHALAVTLNSMLDRVDRAREREASFVADVAHELRSPLASMRMQVDVARRVGDGGELAEGLHEDIDRLVVLVDDLLALARLDASEGGTTLMAVETVVDVRAALERAAGGPGPGEVRVTDCPDLQVLMGEGELDRVLTNLVGNARRHADHVELSAREAGPWVVVVVDDDGPGIPEEQRDQAFERFTRLDEARDREAGGSGLGLAIVRQLVRNRGGEVALAQAPSGGLRVLVNLRRARA